MSHLLYLQPEIDAAVKVLLQLKSDYKSLVGKDWKPGAASGTTPKKQDQGTSASTPIKQEIESEPPQAAGMDGLSDIGPLMEKIDIQGTKVRDLKAAKAPKVCKCSESLTPERKKASYRFIFSAGS